jgi:hypothetical protein
MRGRGAGRGPASPGDWRRWLPTWLPVRPLAKLVSKANSGIVVPDTCTSHQEILPRHGSDHADVTPAGQET